MSTSSGRYVSLKSNKPVQVDKIGEEKTSTYPSDWFLKESKKPTFARPKYALPMEELRKVVLASIGKTLSVNVAIDYACRVLEDVKERVNGKWDSYEQVIADDSEITPLSLVHVKDTVYSIEGETMTSSASKADDGWLMLVISGVYRVERATDETYKRGLVSNLTNMARTKGMDDTVFLNMIFNNHRGWVSSGEYRKLIAMIDMFFFRFDQNERAYLRTGTIGSRFKDCAALLTYNYASSLIGLTNQGDLLLWIFNESLADEAMRMFKEGEEYGSQYSYFPYQVDFGLCVKSAYSARINPAMHFFGNIIGTMMTQVRSHNARMLLDSQITDVLSNAQLVGYVFATRTERKIQFMKEGDHRLQAGLDSYAKSGVTETVGASAPDAADISDDSPPAGRDPLDWFSWYDKIGGKPTEDMKRFFTQVQANIIGARPGSIGSFCKGPLFAQGSGSNIEYP